MLLATAGIIKIVGKKLKPVKLKFARANMVNIISPVNTTLALNGQATFGH